MTQWTKDHVMKCLREMGPPPRDLEESVEQGPDSYASWEEVGRNCTNIFAVNALQAKLKYEVNEAMWKLKVNEAMRKLQVLQSTQPYSAVGRESSSRLGDSEFFMKVVNKEADALAEAHWSCFRAKYISLFPEGLWFTTEREVQAFFDSLLSDAHFAKGLRYHADPVVRCAEGGAVIGTRRVDLLWTEHDIPCATFGVAILVGEVELDLSGRRLTEGFGQARIYAQKAILASGRTWGYYLVTDLKTITFGRASVSDSGMVYEDSASLPFICHETLRENKPPVAFLWLDRLLHGNPFNDFRWSRPAHPAVGCVLKDSKVYLVKEESGYIVAKKTKSDSLEREILQRLNRIRSITVDLGEGDWVGMACEGADISTYRWERVDFSLLIPEISKLHGHGYLHCDICPANLCVDKSGRLKIIDFDLAQRRGKALPSPRTKGRFIFQYTAGGIDEQGSFLVFPSETMDYWAAARTCAYLRLTHTERSELKELKASAVEKFAAEAGSILNQGVLGIAHEEINNLEKSLINGLVSVLKSCQ